MSGRSPIIKVGFLLVATLLISADAYNGCPDKDPPKDVLRLPHPTDCSYFYLCSNGYPKLDRCYANMQFNPVLKVCDWPENAGCLAARSKCPPLVNNDQGEWSPETCVQSYHEVNDRCDLTCLGGAQQSGGIQVTCTEEGWSGMNGLNHVPECKESKCPPLVNNDQGKWSPETCVQSYHEVNGRCDLTCLGSAQQSGGTQVTCTEEGWSGMNGLNRVPECKEVKDLGESFIDRINMTLTGRPANMLFLLDESGSVAPKEFDMEVQFVKALVAGFPLGSERSAGIITFDSRADVDIRLNTADTCSFMKQADNIRYNGGGTNILRALQLAINEMASHSAHSFTIVFLITDGASSTDPKSAADQIKNAGHTLFTVGVANYSPAQLIPLSSLDEAGAPIFYGIDNFKIFKKVADYLETGYNKGDLGC